MAESKGRVVTRREIFALAAKQLRQDFHALSVIPHSGAKGGEAELLVRRFLNEHLPKRFAASSGFIIDPRDNVSKQTDVIIYDAFNCAMYRASENAAIFPSTNVVAVVEVKSILDKEKLEEAFENIAAVKALSKAKLPLPPGFLNSYQTLGTVFAFDCSITLRTLASHYGDLIRKHGLGRHIDQIVVLDKGIIGLAGKPRGHGWNPIVYEGAGGAAGEGTHIAVGVQELKSDSLDGFLRLLLAKLDLFPSFLGHPGFDWSNTESGNQVRLEYLTSITLERDPEKKKQLLEKYAAEAKADFEKNPAPD